VSVGLFVEWVNVFVADKLGSLTVHPTHDHIFWISIISGLLWYTVCINCMLRSYSLTKVFNKKKSEIITFGKACYKSRQKWKLNQKINNAKMKDNNVGMLLGADMLRTSRLWNNCPQCSTWGSFYHKLRWTSDNIFLITIALDKWTFTCTQSVSLRYCLMFSIR